MSSLASPMKRMKVEESSLLDPIRKVAIVSSIEDAGSGKKIGTHDGKFHCDEALAIAMLKFLPAWSDATVVRSRNPEVLAKCDIVVDVGGKYDPEAGIFDHHQKGFEGVLEGYGTKLSSAGLVYKHFGREVLAAVTAAEVQWPAEVADVVYHKVYEGLMESIDGIDNGVAVAGAGNLPAYRVTTDLSARVGRLHPAWNEPSDAGVVNECFREAVLLTGAEFLGEVLGLARSWWPARSVVASALEEAPQLDPSGHIMVLESGGLPWQSHVFDIEREHAAAAAAAGTPSPPRLLFCLYTDNSGKWRVQAVPECEGSFESRLKLASEWRGLRDDALSECCGLPGATFVHAAGFIGGHATKEGALAMAQKTIAMGNK